MFSVAVFLLILSSLAVYTIMRPSATRTILLTTHLQVAVLLTGVHLPVLVLLMNFKILDLLIFQKEPNAKNNLSKQGKLPRKILILIWKVFFK